jgi:hypothetical protein
MHKLKDLCLVPCTVTYYLNSIVCSERYMIGMKTWMLKTISFPYDFLVNISFLKLIALDQVIHHFLSI